MKTPEQIIQWLKDQRLYGKFYVNYNRYMHRRWKFDDFLKKTAPEKIFSCAFVWHECAGRQCVLVQDEQQIPKMAQ